MQRYLFIKQSKLTSSSWLVPNFHTVLQILSDLQNKGEQVTASKEYSYQSLNVATANNKYSECRKDRQVVGNYIFIIVEHNLKEGYEMMA